MQSILRHRALRYCVNAMSFHDNSRQLQENSLRRFAFVAFFDMSDSSCPIGKLPFSFLLCDEFLKGYFLSMPQLSNPAGLKVSKGALKLKIKVLGADRISMLQFSEILRPPAKKTQIELYQPHLGKEKPVMGNIEPLLGIT